MALQLRRGVITIPSRLRQACLLLAGLGFPLPVYCHNFVAPRSTEYRSSPIFFVMLTDLGLGFLYVLQFSCGLFLWTLVVACFLSISVPLSLLCCVGTI